MSQRINTETMFSNFKIASTNWINSLEQQLKSIDKEKEPNAFEFINHQLENAKYLHFELTGRKSNDFKHLCNTILI